MRMSYKKGKDVKKKVKGGGSDFGMLSVKAGIDKNPKFKGQSGFTFESNIKKTMSKSELKDQADFLNKTGKYKVKKGDK